MKKMLISLVLLVPLLTGCANIDTRVTINDDKSGSVVTSLSYNGDLSDKSDKVVSAIDDIYNKIIGKDYKVEKVASSKFSTITAVKNSKDLSKEDLDLSSLGFVSKLDSKKFVEVKKNFIISSFNIDCVYDDAKNRAKFDGSIKEQEVKLNAPPSINPEYFHKYADPEEFNTVPVSSEDFVSNLDDDTKQAIKDLEEETEKAKQAEANRVKTFSNSFSIQVPSIASFNNADSVTGNIYTWTLDENESKEIKLQYVQYSGWGIAFIILFGIFLLVFLAGKVLKHESNKRIDNIKNIV